jgi:nucleoside-diphosphate-sugar epimerase
MQVLLTGGSGNLGHILVPKLLDKGDTPVIMDIRAPRDLKKGALFIEESILDRPKLTQTFRGCDCIVHIAAWHGIHEDRGEKNAYDFFDLNVRGTFEVCEAAASAGIDKVIFISTTSVYRPDTLYGRSKILAELIAEDYRKHRHMNVVTLRPRGFIPHWDGDMLLVRSKPDSDTIGVFARRRTSPARCAARLAAPAGRALRGTAAPPQVLGDHAGSMAPLRCGPHDGAARADERGRA